MAELADAIDLGSIGNTVQVQVLSPAPYPKDVVDNYWNLNREDPDKYPNTDWLSLLLKDYAVRQSHNVSFRSGSAKRSTSLNFGYDDVDGLFIQIM